MTQKTLFLLAIVWIAACTTTKPAVPYLPVNASDNHGGVSVTVLDVIPGNQSTAVDLRVAWPDANWDFYWTILEYGPVLRDSAGHEYELLANPPAGDAVTAAVTRRVVDLSQTATPDPAGGADEKTFTFALPPATAETLTLQIDALDFVTDVTGSFTVDLGPTPQIGQRWPLDVTLDAAGFPVRITAVNLTEPEEPTFNDRTACCRLVFDLEVEQKPDHTLESLLLQIDSPSYTSSSGRYTLGELRPSLTMETLPDSPFSVTLDQVSILVPGPWRITWPVPEP